MKILCDYQIYVRQKIGGISRYFAEISSRIPSLEPNVQVDNKVLLPCNYYLCERNQIKRYNYNNNKMLRSLSLLLNDFYTFITIYLSYIRKKPYDVIHITWYKPFYIRMVKKICRNHEPRIIMSVYDLIHERECEVHPEYRSGVKDRKKMLRYADEIIAISQHTKNDLLKYYPEVNPDRVNVIYLATDIDKNVSIDSIDLPLKYVLFVGKRQGYKNFINFIKAMSAFKDDNELNIVCAGGGAFTYDEQDVIDEYWDKKRIIQKFFTDEELMLCYQKAICFIFPSVYEGFGIPILEAFENECPVALSESSCFPEIAGDAAVYFDGGNVESISDSIARIIYDEEMQEKLKRRGRKRLELFSWEKTSKETLDVYRREIKKD